MSRVMKRFLQKISVGTSIVIYCAGTMLLSAFVAEHFGYEFEFGLTIGSIVFVAFPFLIGLIMIAWVDARDEVRRENRAMMKDIKDE